MSGKELIFILIVFLANTIEGITGFAGTMLAMPPSMLLIGVKEAKAALNIVAIIVSSGIAIRNYKDVNKREVIKITLFMLVGMVAGLYLFSVLPLENLSVMYGALIIIVAIRGLFVKKQSELPAWALIFIVLGAGVIHGMFLSGGALLVLYAVSVLKDKSMIRATLAPVWVILNCIILVQDIMVGVFTPEILRLTAFSIPPLILALVLGNILHKVIRQEAFVKLTYMLLIVAGLTLLF